MNRHCNINSLRMFFREEGTERENTYVPGCYAHPPLCEGWGLTEHSRTVLFGESCSPGPYLCNSPSRAAGEVRLGLDCSWNHLFVSAFFPCSLLSPSLDDRCLGRALPQGPLRVSAVTDPTQDIILVKILITWLSSKYINND